MVSQRFREALLDVYHGEQFGEAFFEALLPHAEDGEQHYILGSLLQLESEGKAVMRPILAKLGLSLEEDPASRPRGASTSAMLREMPWTDKFAAMADGIRGKGLPQYEELATLVTAEEDREAFALASFMATHERAILKASENIAAQRGDPIAPVVEILHFPLIKPSPLSLRRQITTAPQPTPRPRAPCAQRVLTSLQRRCPMPACG